MIMRRKHLLEVVWNGTGQIVQAYILVTAIISATFVSPIITRRYSCLIHSSTSIQKSGFDFES